MRILYSKLKFLVKKKRKIFKNKYFIIYKRIEAIIVGFNKKMKTKK